ncbi:hypothetical protein [Amycolatopsis regifaucium]|uniref:Uncharacterized protein n=1 Tax=Amycolatopsis regifaucium TaxID=546365 RepID=A0A154MYU6_9PSEU|nr:hypothetical protein [Amycolatopsis regifaucium]KZB88639.1 hypothetical protein AVL48_00735 [Amycolatopsis regifaucium]OKA07805.1 hypothetical protein ATP06_0215055 [Amycolatopsis regifaucium]
MTTTPDRQGEEAPELPALTGFGCLMGFFMTVMALIGPLLLWLSTRFDPADDDRLVVIAMGAVFTIGGLVTVASHLWQNARAREVHRALDRSGVRATAEVVSSKRIWVGEVSTPAEDVDFVVTGPGVTTFSARLLTEDVGRYETGTVVPVDVDPRTLLFRLAD